jgi:hypothetical protein
MLSPSDFKPKCRVCNFDEAYFTLCRRCKEIIDTYALWRLEAIVLYLKEKQNERRQKDVIKRATSEPDQKC